MASGAPRPAARRRAQALELSIGGIHTTITSGDRDLTLTAPPAVARFAVTSAPGDVGDIRIEASWTDGDPVARGQQLFDSGGLWRLYAVGRQLAFTFTTAKFGSAPYKTAVVEPDFSAGAVYLHRPYFDQSLPLYPLEYPLDEILVTNWLALGRGVEMHACGVVDSDGAGYLFAGHSGDGKTTTARLWRRQRGVLVLSDDRIILRKIGDEVWMYGTPWHGDEPLAAPRRALLTRGFFLKHAKRNKLAPVGGAEVVAKLFARSFPPFYSERGLEYTLSALGDITRLIPFADFGFVPDRAVIALVRGAR